MKTQLINGLKSIRVPGLIILSEDEDLLFPALMLIQLDGVVKYSQEDRKTVLVIPGEQPYQVRNSRCEDD